MEKPETISQIVERVCGEVCDHFCIYKDTPDSEGNCLYIREGHDYPLDQLY